MSDATENDVLGFAYRIRKSGEVVITQRGQLAATLRGAVAQGFILDAESGSGADAQQLMARVTGNYKRGNERTRKNHLRNRA